MRSEIIRNQSPEERELEKKAKEFAALETLLADREVQLATLRAELHSFEHRYLASVGRLYAELDEILADIAELRAGLNPDDAAERDRARDARERAGSTAESVRSHTGESTTTKFEPSDRLRRLYRELAKRIHPDLAATEEERARRHRLMVDANAAYEAGDEARLEALLRDVETSPESVQGDDIASHLIRVIRKIAQANARLAAIDVEMQQLRDSELYELFRRAEEAQAAGRDLLAEMAADVHATIDAKRQVRDSIAARVRTR